MNLKTLVIGNSKKDGSSFKKLVEDNGYPLQIVGTTTALNEAIDQVRALGPDLIIIYPNSSLQQLLFVLELFPRPSFEVIFVVDHPLSSIRSIRLPQVQYLVQPVQAQKLELQIMSILQRKGRLQLSERSTSKQSTKEPFFNKLAIAHSNGFVFTEKEEIIACEASRNYTFFFLTGNRKLVACKPLKYFEVQFINEPTFFRINRSFIINLSYLDGYIRSKKGEIILKNGMRLGLSGNRKEAFLQKIDLMAS